MKIKKLTPEQEARFPEFVKRWTDIGLSTEPTDRKRAEAAINSIYAAAGLPAPKRIVWCGSPLSQGITRAIILDQKMFARVGDSVWASVGDSVRASVGDSVWDSVWASVGDSVRDSVRDSVGDSVRDSVRDSVWDSVRDSVGASVWDSVWASVGDSVEASVGASVRASVWAGVEASVGASVRASVWDSVEASVRDSVWASVYGQHDVGWLAFYDFFRDAVGLEQQTEQLAGLQALAQSAGWAIPHANICWVSERHNILHRDERGRLHSLIGPACAYPDGWAIYAVHGVRVPSWIIEHPEQLSAQKIESEQNAEVRRVMIDRYGADRYLRDSGALKVQQDDYGILYRKDLQGDEPIVMVRLLNPTPELDGTLTESDARKVFGDSVVNANLSVMTRIGFASHGEQPRFREYWLRVPPTMQTAREAVAWTFNVPPDQYVPEVQT